MRNLVLVRHYFSQSNLVRKYISNVTYVDVVIRCCVTIIIINRKRKDVGSSWKIKNHPIFGALLDNTSVLLCCRLCSSSIW